MLILRIDKFYFVVSWTRKGSAGNDLPCLDLVVLGHGAREFVVELPQGRHVREGGVQEVAAQCLVANVIDVVLTEKETSTEVIDPLYGGDAEALDAPQEILEGYQIPETEVSRVSRSSRGFLPP